VSDAPVKHDAGYAGLTRAVDGLPACWYYDPAHHARELAAIWYRNWIYVCRSSEMATPRSYRTFAIGDQSLLLVRDELGVLRGFHNTCRHRGAELCRDQQGRLPPAGIVCPYHSWRYSLRGELLQTTSQVLADNFEPRDFHLYRIAVTEWNGLTFICLSADPPPFAGAVDQPLERLDNWHIADLVTGHTFRKTIACNWKVFWENYNECLHCPNVHPRLSQLVPIFGRGMQDERDDPRWLAHRTDADPKYRGGMRSGAESWSMDGRTVGALFPGLTDADRAAGHIYVTCMPSAFIVAHVDYVRIVRLRPLAPEQTELSVEFLFLPETLADPGRDIGSAVEFTSLVMNEDAEVCELNQRGLHAIPHQRGVLMPEEYVISGFQEWVRTQLAQA
jgi:glycine betaine catabolism A